MRQWQRWMIVLVAGILLMIAIAPKGMADAETRLPAIEAELSNLRMRLDRLESQLSGGGRLAPAVPSTTPSAIGGRTLSKDPMFDRLATLVIETKQDVQGLEQRVSRLENSKKPR